MPTDAWSVYCLFFSVMGSISCNNILTSIYFRIVILQPIEYLGVTHLLSTHATKTKLGSSNHLYCDTTLQAITCKMNLRTHGILLFGISRAICIIHFTFFFISQNLEYASFISLGFGIITTCSIRTCCILFSYMDSTPFPETGGTPSIS